MRISNRQSSEASSSQIVSQLRGALQETRVEIAGYVTAEDVHPDLHLAELEERLVMLGTGSSPSRALLVLRTDGGQIIPYAQEAPARPVQDERAIAPEVATESTHLLNPK